MIISKENNKESKFRQQSCRGSSARPGQESNSEEQNSKDKHYCLAMKEAEKLVDDEE